MTKALTTQQVIDWLKINKPNVLFLDDYVNAKTYYNVIFKFCGHKVRVTYDKLRTAKHCPICIKRRPSPTNCLAFTHPHLISEWSAKNDITPYDIVAGSGKKVWWQYSCGHEVFARVSSHAIKQYGCRVCLTKSHDKYIDEVKKNNPRNITVFSKYINKRTKIQVQCNICNHIWATRPDNLLKGCGCPNCYSFKGELKIEQWLSQHNIRFERNKIFENCKDKSYLRFDFFLPLKNICIEYDGIQHFKQIYNWESPDKILRRDQIKDQYCHDNNILMIRISYDRYDNIDNILADKLISKH